MISVTPLTSAVVWRRSGHAAVEVGAGDLLSIDADGQDLSHRAGKGKPNLARFAAWPEQPGTLFFASFETDVQSGERPLVVQGAAKEGFVSAVTGSPRKKVIELNLPSPLGNADVVVRLRLRTTGARIQCGGGPNSSRGGLQAIPLRSRSETVWTTVTIPLPAGDDGHLGGGRGKRGSRGSLTISVEPSGRAPIEDLVFDLDEIEILRS
jgi:hypothetical protein